MTYLRFILLLILSMLASCKTSQSTEGKEAKGQAVSYELIGSGGYSGINTTQQIVIQDQETWLTLWQKTYSNRMPAPDPIVVDFEKDQIMACYMGERTSGGYSLEVSSILQKNNRIIVSLNHVSPGENCMSTDALTQPFVFIRIAKSTMDCIFQIKSLSKDC